MQNIIKLIKNNYMNYTDLAIIILLFVGFFPITDLVIGNIFLEILTRGVFLLIWIFFIFLRLRNDSFKLILDSGEKYVILFCIITFISTLPFGRNSFFDYIFPLVFLLSYIGINSFFRTGYFSSESINKCLHITVALAILHIIFMGYRSSNIVFSIFSLSDLKVSGMKRAYLMRGILDTSNTFALQMFIGYMATLSLFIKNLGKKKYVYFYLIIAIIFLSMILFTVSRGALFALMIFSTIIFIQLIRRKDLVLQNLRKLLPALILISTILVIISIKYNLLSNVVAKFSHGTTHRAGTWHNFIILKIQEFPSIEFFRGYSYDGFQDIVKTLSGKPTMKQIHNIFLELWGRFGFFSMIILMNFIIKKVYSNFKSSSLSWYILAIPIAMISRELFEVVLFIGVFRWEMVFFWIMLLAPFYIDQNSQNKNQKI